MMNQSDVKDEATRRVEAALLLLPGTLTAAYSVALLQSPELIGSESDPCLFLQSEKDFQKAAFKLSMYWSKRYIYFGARAYLPLNQSGSGALSPDDIAALPASCLQPLPPDSQGRAVYWMSSAKAMNFQTEADIRCLFYQLQLAKGGLSAAQGIVFLLLVEGNTNFARLNKLLCLISELLATVMPFRMRHLHILSRNPSENVSLAVSGVVKLAMDKSLSQEYSIGTAKSASSQEMIGKLVPFGLSPQGLPPELGGTYVPMMHAAAATTTTGEAMAEELDMLDQAKVAWGSQLAAASQDCSSSAALLPVLPLWGHCNMAEAVARAFMSAQTAGKQDDRKRKAIDPEQNKNRPSALRKKNPASPPPPPPPPKDAPKLAASYANLMNELPSHCALAGMIAPDDGASINDLLALQREGTAEEQEAARKAMVRKRNALYSRRKYVRRRIEVEVMEGQRTSLMAENASLVQERQRLEALVAAANQCVDSFKSSSIGLTGNAGLPSDEQHSASRQQEPAARREYSPTSRVAAALARHQRQLEQGGPSANGQVTVPLPTADTESAASDSVHPPPAGPTSHDMAKRPVSKMESSLAAAAPADRTAAGHMGNAPTSTRAGIFSSLRQNPTANSDISNLISLLTRGVGTDTRGLAILGGQWTNLPSASITRPRNDDASSAMTAASGNVVVGSSQGLRPLWEPGFASTTMLHSAGVMPSSLLTRPYMQGTRGTTPLLPNAHLSSSSDDDSEEQTKKPAV